MNRSLLAILVLLIGGCARRDVSFDSKDPGGRIQAAINAAAENDQTAIPGLIEMLDSDDPAARFVAIGTLERFTGQTFGYDFADPEWRRREAVNRWVSWYDSRPDDDG